MRLLFIVHQFMPEFATGTERVTFNLAKAAQRDGHDVTVLTRARRNAGLWSDMFEDGFFSTVAGLPVYGVRVMQKNTELTQFGFLRDVALEVAFTRFFDNQKPYDLVHVTHPLGMIEAIELACSRRIPYIMTVTDCFTICHQIYLKRLNGENCNGPESGKSCKLHCLFKPLSEFNLALRRLRMSNILRSAFDIVACSSFISDQLQQEMPTLPLRVIGHGVDLPEYRTRDREKRHGTLVFGFLGSISEAKGVHVLAEAFARTAPMAIRLEIVGTTLGTSENEKVTRVLRTLASRDQRIELKPWVQESAVPDVLAGFDVFCLPSLVPETFSLVLHGALAAGLPSLVSNLGFPATIVEGHRCGAVVGAGEIDAWTEMITRVAEQPSMLDDWKKNVPMPMRIEEEAFMYSQLYQSVFQNL